MFIEQQKEASAAIDAKKRKSSDDNEEDEFRVTGGLDLNGDIEGLGGYCLPSVEQVFHSSSYNDSLFPGALVGSDSQMLYSANALPFLGSDGLCSDLDMMGFISPSAIDNFNNTNNAATVEVRKPSSSGGGSNKRRRSSAPSEYKPPSPRGRPKSVYGPGEKPRPPNMYDVYTSPTMHSSPLLNARSPYMMASPPMYHHHTQQFNQQQLQQHQFTQQQQQQQFTQQPSIMPAPHWMFTAPFAAYYGNAGAGAYTHTKVPMAPLARPRAKSQPESLLGTPLGLAQQRQQELVKQQPHQLSPTSSLDSQPAAASDDSHAFLVNVQLAKTQFMEATKSLDFTNVTVHEMKAILRRFGLMTTGKKVDLINRIILTRKCLQETPSK